ncbi:uncharacterized protein I303_105003 [Kwoniella dejecticola CBS 10117]|uniref:Uncharacterized protein n=1 Tax=Kwoniella dejecticola CBS 10117 TaxID=1296121 RepID=A0A1A6A3Q9_9TREE|nr:uncharacterized protein I303_05552 [Kwoniella dejecticola CBS 10117]OBR84693.1 hypothetical protein I303_05552 [Kwoniella dejecticola CBS 10117]
MSAANQQSSSSQTQFNPMRGGDANTGFSSASTGGFYKDGEAAYFTRINKPWKEGMSYVYSTRYPTEYQTDTFRAEDGTLHEVNAKLTQTRGPDGNSVSTYDL